MKFTSMLGTLLACALCAASQAMAQDYPNRPIRLD